MKIAVYPLVLALLTLAACGGSQSNGSGSANPTAATTEVAALNGKWTLTSVTCNGDPSTVWQQQQSKNGMQAQLQIQDGTMNSNIVDNSGCQLQSSQTFKSLGSTNFTVTTVNSSASSQCTNPPTSDTKSFQLSISVTGNTLSISDPSTPSLCTAANQTGPEVSSFSRNTQ